MNGQPMRRETDSISSEESAVLKLIPAFQSMGYFILFLFKMYQVFTQPIQEEIF